MQLALHGDAGAGIHRVDLADGVGRDLLQLAVVHQHRPERDGKDHVVVLDEALRLALAHELARPGEEHVARGGEEAGVHGRGVVAVERALIDGDAEVAVFIEVAVDGDDRVGGVGHGGGVELHARAVAVAGDLAPDLRAVGDLDLGEGAAAVFDVLLPGEDKDRVVQIVAEGSAGHELDVGAEDQLLPVEHDGGLLDHRLDLVEIVGDAEAVGVRSGRDGVALLQSVDLADVRQIAERVGRGVVDVDVELVGQAKSGVAALIAHGGGRGMEIEDRPGQHEGAEQQGNQPQRDPQREREHELFTRRRGGRRLRRGRFWGLGGRFLRRRFRRLPGNCGGLLFRGGAQRLPRGAVEEGAGLRRWLLARIQGRKLRRGERLGYVGCGRGLRGRNCGFFVGARQFLVDQDVLQIDAPELRIGVDGLRGGGFGHGHGPELRLGLRIALA